MATNTPGPLHAQITADLREQINSGALPVGQPIPSMSQLRETYGVSGTVIREALSPLKRDGLLEGVPGKAVYVKKRATEPSLSDPAQKLHEQLDEIMNAIRGLDQRLQRLEQGDGSGSPAPGQPT